MNLNVKPAILSFIDWYKPAYKAGGPVRSMVNLAELLQDDVALYVVCGDREIDGHKLNVELNSWIHQDTNEQVSYCKKPTLALIKEWVKQHPNGVFHINGIYSARFSILPLFLLKTFFPNKRIVVSPRGMLNEGALQIKPFKKNAFIAFARGLGLFNNVIWHTTSEEEEQRIRKFFPTVKQMKVLSNIPIAPVKPAMQCEKNAGSLQMFAVTRIVPIKKLETILNALKQYPVPGNITFDVFGPIEDQRYAEILTQLATEIPNLTFHFKGAVEPNKLSELSTHYHLFCLPSSNENFGHSIYEAFANACPVLISDQTPWKNLQNEKAGFELALNNLKGFSDRMTMFSAMTTDELEQWRQGAFVFAQKHYNKEKWIASYLTLFVPNE